jgi:hypothetical protein
MWWSWTGLVRRQPSVAGRCHWRICEQFSHEYLFFGS